MLTILTFLGANARAPLGFGSEAPIRLTCSMSRKRHNFVTGPAGHEPFPECRSSDFLGRAVPEERRERGQAPLHPPPARRPVAQGPLGAECLVRGADQGYLPACPVSAAQSTPGPTQGHRSGGGRHADGDLSQAEARGGVL